MRCSVLVLALALLLLLAACGRSDATSVNGKAAEVGAALEQRLLGRKLSYRWVVCVRTKRSFAGTPIFRCNVNFGEPHIVRYCATLKDGLLVTNREQPEMRCGRATAWPADPARAAVSRRAPPRPHPSSRRAVGLEYGLDEKTWRPAGSAGFRDLGRAEPAFGGSALAADIAWRRILVLASAVGFFEALLFSVLAPLLPDFEDGLGLSKASAGLLTSAYAAGAFIGALPSIWAARRFGVKATVLAGLILLAISSAAFTAPESAWLVFAARVGQGWQSCSPLSLPSLCSSPPWRP